MEDFVSCGSFVESYVSNDGPADLGVAAGLPFLTVTVILVGTVRCRLFRVLCDGEILAVSADPAMMDAAVWIG